MGCVQLSTRLECLDRPKILITLICLLLYKLDLIKLLFLRYSELSDLCNFWIFRRPSTVPSAGTSAQYLVLYHARGDRGVVPGTLPQVRVGYSSA